MRAAVPAALACALAAAPALAGEVLYDQDFERPTGYVNDGHDLNIHRSVNDNYGDQPLGFRFAQAFTVETLNVSGSQRGAGVAAFGDGYRDPSGVAGDFAIGIQQNLQDDRLGLLFERRGKPWLNLVVDISSADASGWGGPSQPEGGLAPHLKFTLFDTSSANPSTHSGHPLDSATIIGVASPSGTLTWTSHKISLDATEARFEYVILQIDLIEGLYAAFDNLLIVAADDPDDLGAMNVIGGPLR